MADASSLTSPAPIYPLYPGTIPGLGLPGPGAGLPYAPSGGSFGQGAQQQQNTGAASMGGPITPGNAQALPATNQVLTPGVGAAAAAGPRPRSPQGFPLADIGMQVMR